jgi:predicted MPP superfamily phosphohydrolase
MTGSTIWVLLHAYIWSRLFGATTAGATVPPFILLAALPFVALFVARHRRGWLIDLTSWLGYTALALSSFLLTCTLAADLLLVRWWLPPHAVTALVIGSAVALTVGGAWQARFPAVVRVSIPIANLSPALEGFRIVQLSDLHVSSTLKRRFVERVVSTVNALDPDLIALTGDIADAYPADAREDVSPLGRLKAAHGKFFVTGNHEYFWDATGWVTEVERLGFEPLINAHRIVPSGGASVLVAGVTDRLAGGAIPGHHSDPRAAIADAPAADIRVLLAHQPISAFDAHKVGFDLQLSGHTHGGQYFPFTLLVRLFQPFVAGLHRLGDMWLYVSRGTGYWGPPVRIFAPSEITVVELTAA